MRAEILTAWGQSGDANHPQVDIDYTLRGWQDITGQPAENITPDPNLYSILVECDAATLAAIDADPNYFVLWSEA